MHSLAYDSNVQEASLQKNCHQVYSKQFWHDFFATTDNAEGGFECSEMGVSFGSTKRLLGVGVKFIIIYDFFVLSLS